VPLPLCRLVLPRVFAHIRRLSGFLRRVFWSLLLADELPLRVSLHRPPVPWLPLLDALPPSRTTERAPWLVFPGVLGACGVPDRMVSDTTPVMTAV
jgi:hypothetical protein